MHYPSLQVHRGWSGLPETARGATVAMGNFDGVHLGHRAVIEAARNARPDCPLGVVTFEPHPREYFATLRGGAGRGGAGQEGAGRPAPFRLMNAEARASRLCRLGVVQLYELPFGPDLAALSAEAFVAEVLAGGAGRGLGVAHVAVGEDFRFGRDRGGDARTLARLCAERGIGTTILPLVGAGTAPASSTAVRAALAEGRPREAEAMLGHWHRIEGEVLHGAKRGRELGYPTANMALDGLALPRMGVYAVLVDVLTGPHRGRYGGVASLGVRPMFGENAPNLETHLFDFSGDLYGQHLSVALVDYLRPEARFDSLDALVAQMRRDEAEARAILAR